MSMKWGARGGRLLPEGLFMAVVISSTSSESGDASWADRASLSGILIWRPGGTASGNVYTDFSLLMAAAGGIGDGEGVMILFDDTFASLDIPVGAYGDAFKGQIWRAAATMDVPTITFPTGVTATSFPDEIINLELEATSTSAVFTLTTDHTIFLRKGELRGNGATAPLIDCQFGISLSLTDNSVLRSRCIQPNSGVSSINVRVWNWSDVRSDAFDAGTTSQIICRIGSTAQFDAQTVYVGTINLTRHGSAAVMPGFGASNPRTATHFANVGERVVYDPTGGTFTINAPVGGLNVGDRWAVKNASTSVTAVTISGNGSNIEDPTGAYALAASFSFAGNGFAAEWEYDGAAWLCVAERT